MHQVHGYNYAFKPLKVNYIVAMENSNTLRNLGRLLHLEYKEKEKESWIMSWWNKLLGIDYATQEKLVDDTYNDTFDPDEENKVTIMVMKLYSCLKLLATFRLLHAW